MRISGEQAQAHMRAHGLYDAGQAVPGRKHFVADSHGELCCGSCAPEPKHPHIVSGYSGMSVNARECKSSMMKDAKGVAAKLTYDEIKMY